MQSWSSGEMGISRSFAEPQSLRSKERSISLGNPHHHHHYYNLYSLTSRSTLSTCPTAIQYWTAYAKWCWYQQRLITYPLSKAPEDRYGQAEAVLVVKTVLMDSNGFWPVSDEALYEYLHRFACSHNWRELLLPRHPLRVPFYHHECYVKINESTQWDTLPYVGEIP